MSLNHCITIRTTKEHYIKRTRKPPIYASRRINQKTIREKGIDECKRRVLENLEDTTKMIEWNEQNGMVSQGTFNDIFPLRQTLM